MTLITPPSRSACGTAQRRRPDQKSKVALSTARVPGQSPAKAAPSQARGGRRGALHSRKTSGRRGLGGPIQALSRPQAVDFLDARQAIMLPRLIC